MRICYCIDHLRPDGTQQVLRQLIEGLAARGHEQMVVCLNNSWDEVLVAGLREAGAQVRIVGKRALMSGVGLPLLWYWLRHEPFDVVVTLLFHSDVIGRLLARAAGVPRIVSSLRARNIHYTSWQRWLVQSTMRWADAVVINSTHGRNFAVAEEGVQPDHIHVIPNGVKVEDYQWPLSRDALRAEFGLAPDQQLVGSVGRLTHQKGFDQLLQAFARVPRQDIHLLLVGTGEDAASLRAQAATLGIHDRVSFAGYRRDVPRLLGALDLYVHAARFEGMPNALLEAMAARCPIVASSVDGVCDLIKHGVHGWLVPAENTGVLAEAIQVALSDPMEAQRRAIAAQQHVALHFSVEAMIVAWEKVLRGGIVRVNNLPRKASPFLNLNTQDAISRPAKHFKMFGWLGLSAQCGVGMLLLWWVIAWSDVGSKQLVQRLAQASYLGLMLGILCFVMAIGLGALRYRLFLPSSASITYLIGVTLFQNALLTFTPWRLGEMGYPLLLRRDHNISLVSSGAMILAIRLVDLLVVLTVALVGARKLGLDAQWVSIIFGAIALLTLFIGFTLAVWKNDAPILLLQALLSALRPLREARRLAGFALFSISVFALTTLQSAFILRALGLTVTLSDTALLNATSLLAALLPIHPPGGWGTMDSIQVVILGRLNYNQGTSTSTILANHLFYTLLILVGGIIGWLLINRTRIGGK